MRKHGLYSISRGGDTSTLQCHESKNALQPVVYILASMKFRDDLRPIGFYCREEFFQSVVVATAFWGWLGIVIATKLCGIRSHMQWLRWTILAINEKATL